MGSRTIEDKVRDIVLPLLSDLDIELYDLEYNGGRLVITIDTELGIDSGTLYLATKAISRELDAQDPIASSYTLEIGSPGLERKLRRPVHWEKSIGCDVVVKVDGDFSESRRISGRIMAADDVKATILVPGDAADDEGSEIEIPYAVVQKARTVFEWGPAPKPGGAKLPHDGPKGGAKKQNRELAGGAKKRGDGAASAKTRDPEKQESDPPKKEASAS